MAAPPRTELVMTDRLILRSCAIHAETRREDTRSDPILRSRVQTNFRSFLDRSKSSDQNLTRLPYLFKIDRRQTITTQAALDKNKRSSTAFSDYQHRKHTRQKAKAATAK